MAPHERSARVFHGSTTPLTMADVSRKQMSIRIESCVVSRPKNAKALLMEAE